MSTHLLTRPKTGFRVYGFLLFWLLSLSGITTTYAQTSAPDGYAPTVTSDKDDYAPGETAHITGSGWSADQMVHVEFKEEPDYPDYHVYDVAVKEDGTWQIDYAIEQRHLGVKFTVTAVGQQTGSKTTMIFTDSRNDYTASLATAAICSGQVMSITLKNISTTGNPRSFQSFDITIPSGVNISGVTVDKPAWSAPLTPATGQLDGHIRYFTTSNAISTISTNNSIKISFIVTATASSPITRIWTTAAYTNSDWSFNSSNPQFTLTDNSNIPISTSPSLIINPASVGGIASASLSTLCSGSGTEVSLSEYSGNIQWQISNNYNIANPGTATWNNIQNASSPTLATGNLSQTSSYRAVVTNGGCNTSPSTIATVSVETPPTVAAAGADQPAVCGTTTQLAATAPTVGSGFWSIVSGEGGHITAATSSTSEFTGTAGSTYKLRWITTNGAACAPSTDDVQIAFAPTLGTVSTITGNSLVDYGSTGIGYAINAVANATTYTWHVPSGASFTQAPDGLSISVNWGTAVSGTISVDASNGCYTSTASQAVTVNRAPVATAATVGANEDTSLSITLTGTDADSDALTYTIGTAPAHGTLSGTGASRTYTPAANYNGADSFTFTVNDGRLDSAPATISITVTPVNDAPVATAQAVSTDEDTNQSGTLTGTDIDSPILTFALGTQATHGTVTVQPNGSYSYLPAANYNGPDSFSFTSNDGSLTSPAATVSITVDAVNDAPVATAQSVSTQEDTEVEIVLAGTDVDGDPLTYTPGTVNHGSLAQKVGASNTYIYTPTGNYNGPSAFSFTVNDGNLTSEDAIVSITVNAVNDAPVATGQSLNTDEDTQKTGTLAGSDIEGANLTFALATNAENGTVTVDSNGEFSYTPNANYNGSDSFTFRANDGEVDSEPATVSITVNAVNDAPILAAISTPAAINEDASEQTVLLSDISSGAANEIQTLTVTASSNNPSLIEDITVVYTSQESTGSLKYTPKADQYGSALVTVNVNDGDLEVTRTFTVTVSSVNDAPSFTKGADQTVLEDAGAQTVSGWATAISAGPANESTQQVAFQIISNSASALFTADGQPTINTAGQLTYTPAANANGTATIHIKLTDDGGTDNSGVAESAEQIFAINITAVNDAPVAANDAGTVNEDAALYGGSVLTNDTDVDDATLTAVLVTGPAHGSLTLSPDGSYTYTPAANYNGLDSFIYKAQDAAHAGSNPATVALTVTAVNDAPVADAMTISTNEDTEKTGTLTGSDIEGSPLTFALGTAAAHGTATVQADGSFSYQPAADYYGPDSFTFTVQDGELTSTVATVSVTVNAVNDAPTLAAVDAPAAINEDAAEQTVSLSGISTGAANEAQTLTVTAISDNTALLDNPTVVYTSPQGTGTLKYTPKAQQFGSATVTVKVSDGEAETTRNFTITVNPVNDAPSFVKGNDQVVNEDAAAQTVTGWATALSAGPANEASQTLSFVLSNSNTGLFAAQPAVDATGKLTFTPAANANGVATVSVKIKDDGGTDAGGIAESTVQTFTITVNAVNDAPAFTAGANQTVQEDAPASSVTWATAISAGPVNEAAQTVAFIVSNNNTSLFTSTGQPAIDATGKLTYTLAPNANGVATVSVKLKDNGGVENGGNDESMAQNFTLTVNPVNDLPVITSITAPAAPMAINTAVNVSAAFTDVDAFVAGNYSATWNWDDGSTSTGTVSSVNGVLTVNGSYTYRTPGVYNLTLSLTDTGGSTSTTTAAATTPLQATPLTYQYVVIYDPNGGFVTGGGWIWSPKGALLSNSQVEGKANFGFVAKYKKGSTTIVEGSTEFQFKAGDINFNSTSYEAARLVISGSKASYKGEGTINGAGRYGFMTSAVDGQYNNATGADRFRIKIWDINAGGAIVYDNLLDNAADNYDLNAAPTTAIQGGSIVIHNPDVKTSTKSSTLTAADGLTPVATAKATFSNFPNPFSEKTTLTFVLDKEESYELALYDAKGMLMKRIQVGTAEAGRQYSFELSGRELAEGIYFARLVTSSKVQTMRIAVRK